MSFVTGTNRLAAYGMLVLSVVVFGGCSAHRGGLRNSREIGRAFETLHVFPDYRYWYYNLENSPYAVVGLAPEYRIEDRLWTEVDPNSKTFEKVVGLVQDFPVHGSFTYGAYILDPQGSSIGVWYSSLNAGIVVDPESRLVSISTSMPWLYRDDWSGSGLGLGIGSGGGGVGIQLGF